jgi:hypothetical protein
MKLTHKQERTLAEIAASYPTTIEIERQNQFDSGQITATQLASLNYVAEKAK